MHTLLLSDTVTFMNNDLCVRVKLTLCLDVNFSFIFSHGIFVPFFYVLPPSFILSSVSHYISSSCSSLFLSPISDPSVTIATEERPFIEKGIRLAGPSSHLAGSGG